MLLKYSSCFLPLVTFPVLNAVNRSRACSEVAMTAFRFFTKNEQKYHFYVVAKNLGLLFKSHGLHQGPGTILAKGAIKSAYFELYFRESQIIFFNA